MRPEAPPLIGRSSELDAVDAFLDALALGPHAFLLEGDPGIGKSALWAEGVRRARERGYLVLVSRTTQAEGQLPFVALGDLFELVFEQALEGLPEPQRRALDVAMVRADWHGPPIERRAIALAVLGVLRRLAARAPVLLAIDDLQWLDAASATALQFALRRLERERVGLLATRRTRERAVAFESALPEDDVRRLRIPELEPNELGRLLLDQLGLPLPRPALLQVYRLSGGNPFLALEIGRAVQRHEATLGPGEPFPVPLNLRELVRDRLGALSPAGREVGLVASALAQPTVERIEQATAAAGVSPNGLREAVEAGIVEHDGDRVRFTHPLLGSIIYSEASRARRQALHARLANVADDVEERAAHLALAAAGPDPAVAATLDEAATIALRRGAPEVAAELYERALRLTPAPDRILHFRRMVDVGRARAHAGDVPSAKAAFRSAAEAAPDGPARAEALMRLGSMLLFDWEPEPSGIAGIPASLAAYEHALREAEGEPARVAAIELDLAWVHHFRGARIVSTAHARRAVDLAEQLGDEELLARALVAAALNEGRGGNEEARALLRRAFLLERHVVHRQFSDRPQFVHTLFLAAEGSLDEARAILLAEYQRALDRGEEGSLPTLLGQLTIFERRAGNWRDAERYAREAHEAAARGRMMPEYHSGPYAWILALRGRVDDARTIADEGRALADAGGIGPIFGGHRAVLGFIALSTGDARGCADVLDPLSAELTEEIPENGWFRFLADHVEAALELGDRDRAEELVARLAERRRTLLDAAWAAAATERCRGLLLAVAGNREGAEAAFAQAIREHDRVSEPFELARTLLARGRAERRFRRRRASRESLLAAISLFEALDAPLWRERAQEELRRIGGRSPRAGGLSESEARVAELAAAGRTNREIAAELFLSTNTVQAYLKRVYRELGVRSRTELAVKLLPSDGSKSTDSGVSAGTPAS